MYRALFVAGMLATPVWAQVQQPQYAQPAPQGYAQPAPQGYAQPAPQGYAQPQPQYAPAPQGYGQPVAYAAPAPAPELSLDSPDPKVFHYPGIYMVDASGAEGKMRRIEAIQLNLGHKKGGGLLSSVASVANSVNPLAGTVVNVTGIGKSNAGKVKTGGDMTLPGATASVFTQSETPVFYIFYDESIPQAARSASITPWLSAGGAVVSNPTQLKLIEFDGSKKKRELPVGDEIKHKDQIAFSSEMIGRGVYRITLRNALKAGQYGFVQDVMNDDGSIGVRVFDFDIEKTGKKK